MASCIASGKVGWQGVQQVVGTRRSTHGQQEPRTLEVRQHREFMQEPCLFKRASICVGGDVERMPDGGAQCDESTLGLVCVSVPHACPKCGDSWRSWPASTVVRPGLAKISGDACPRFFAHAFVRLPKNVQCPGRELLRAVVYWPNIAQSPFR